MRTLSRRKLKKLSFDEVNEYYRELRKQEYIEDKPITGMKLRWMLHPLFMLLLKADRLLGRRCVQIRKDERINSRKPHIYAQTHVGRYDIESGLEAIGEQAYFLMGDPGEAYLNAEGYFLRANGVIWFDTQYKDDRRYVKEKCIKLLKQGGNLYMFPEGAWNLSPCEFTRKLFRGVADMAIESGADIIPVTNVRYGKKYIICIGKNIDVSGMKKEDADVILEKLREIYATEKLEIYESFGIFKRKELEETQESYIADIMSESENGYDVDFINATRFHDKNNPEPDEVFGPLRRLCRWNGL